MQPAAVCGPHGEGRHRVLDSSGAHRHLGAGQADGCIRRVRTEARADAGLSPRPDGGDALNYSGFAIQLPLRESYH